MTVTSFTCPAGPHVVSDDAAVLGWCEEHREFTGLCAVGWPLLTPPMAGVIERSPWHFPCETAGSVACVITLPGEPPASRLLCEAHAGMAEDGRSPWPPEHLTVRGRSAEAMRDAVARKITGEHPGWTVTHGVNGLVATMPGRDVVRAGSPERMRERLLDLRSEGAGARPPGAPHQGGS